MMKLLLLSFSLNNEVLFPKIVHPFYFYLCYFNISNITLFFIILFFLFSFYIKTYRKEHTRFLETVVSFGFIKHVSRNQKDRFRRNQISCGLMFVVSIYFF